MASTYIAKVVLTDKETHMREWKEEGPADKVLMSAIEYLSKKESKSIYKKIIEFMVEDYNAFDSAMTQLLFKRK